MQKTFLLIALLTSSITFAQIPAGYYNSAAGLYGEDLRVALSDIIDGHAVVSYSDLWTHFSTTDNNSGVVWDMYSDVPSGTPSYTYAFGTDQCGSYSSEGDCYNREHSVPQSWFGGASPMYTDIFQMYPVDGYVNGQRGSWPFGETNSPTATTSNGSKVGPSAYPGYSGTIFEPIDEYKGDFARTYFYMMTRYDNVVSTWSSDMFTGDNLSMWAENMLLDWHLADPVSAKETSRNNAIYWIQGNRNPFIDDPSWVESIWGPTAGLNDSEDNRFSAFVSNNMLHVENDFNEPQIIEIHDIVGNLISAMRVESGSSEVSINASSGVYILTVQNRGYSLKFVK